MMTKVLQILKKLLKANYNLFPPKKLETIIWGKPKYLDFLKEKKYKLDFIKVNIIHVWGEQYNLFILLKCILKLKFSFFRIYL